MIWCVNHAHVLITVSDRFFQTAHRGLSGKTEAPPSASSPVSASSANTASRKSGQGDGDEEEKEEEGEERENEEEEEEENDEEDHPSSPDSGSSMEWRCRECKTRYTERDDYIEHMKNEHGTVRTRPASSFYFHSICCCCFFVFSFIRRESLLVTITTSLCSCSP